MIFSQLSQFNDYGLLLLRLAVGIIFLVHGYQKLKMWRMKPSPEMPAKMLNIMRVLSAVELSAGVALILGFYAQIAASVLALVMLGAIYFKVMVWKKKFTESAGWEFDFLILAVSLAIILTGGGAISSCKI